MSSQKFRGVFKNKDGRFVASIGKGGKSIYLGYFSEFEDAKSARLAGELALFGAHFDRREIEIRSGVANIPLHGRNGAFYGWAIVDLIDLPFVRNIAWTIDPRGYVAGKPVGIKTSVTMHRWIFCGNEPDAPAVDHIDRDKLNNRRSNLRACDQAENSRNTKISKNNTSGKKGVSRSFNGTQWRSRIWKDRKEIHLGVFATREQAAAAYDKAAADLHGEFASPNSEVAL